MVVAVGGWWVVGGALQGVDLQVFGIPCHIASRQPAGGVLPCANPPRCNITCSTPSRFDPDSLDFALRRGTFNGGGGSVATKSVSGPGSASTFCPPTRPKQCPAIPRCPLASKPHTTSRPIPYYAPQQVGPEVDATPIGLGSGLRVPRRLT